MSTVLDVAMCLLLVGAAVTTLAAAPPPDGGDDPPRTDRTAALLATVTTSVPTGSDRLAHETLAGHLATAAVTDASISSDRLRPSSYPEAVRTETANATDDRAYVTATWAAYPDSPLAGNVAAGDEPPANAAVATTVMEVDSGVEAPTDDGSFRALADDLAGAYVAWLFPPERTAVLLRDGRTADRTADRYRRAAATVGTRVDRPVAEADASRANDRLAGELADRLAADLERRYESPAAAAADVRIDRVEIVVRRWEP